LTTPKQEDVSMHNVWLIARREYMERIRTRGFLIATILIPTLMGGGIFAATSLSEHSKTGAHIAIVASQPQPAVDLRQALESGKENAMKVDILPPSPGLTETLDKEIDGKQLDGYLVIHDGNPPTFDFTPRSTADIATASAVKDSLHDVMNRQLLQAHGASAAEMDAFAHPAVVNIVGKGGKRGDPHTSFIVAYILFFLMYMTVLMYGMNVARSIIEEKTSRIFEVLLSTIKPSELLAGKILGVGAVGLTQVGVWMLAAGLLASHAGSLDAVSISPTQLIFFVVYFALGNTLYSSVAASLGAITNSEQELQQLNMFLMMPLFACMLMIGPIISNPNSTLSRVVSQIPFCAPLLMNFRVSLSMPQPWEIALSMLLIVLTIVLVLSISARIYRVGILMYGKKPNLPEIMRWLKYS
jgi:ABC-2 type transport system permease protein